MSKHFLLFIAVATLCDLAHCREWIDDSGSNRIEAEYVRIDGNAVILRKTNGDTIKVPLNKLSRNDQSYARSQAEKTTAPTNFPEVPSPSPEFTGQVRNFPDMGWTTHCLEFSPNGKWLVAGKLDQILVMMDVAKGVKLGSTKRMEHVGQVKQVRYTPDGTMLLACGWKGLIQTWKVNENGSIEAAKHFPLHDKEINCLQISHDGKYVLTGDRKTAKYWNLSTGEVAFTLDLSENDGLVHAHITKNSGQAVICDGKRFILISLPDGEILQWMKIGDYISTRECTTSTDGKLIAYKTGYSEFKIVELKTGKTFPSLEQGYCSGLCFTNNPRYLLAADRKVINLWDIVAGEKVHSFTPLYQHGNDVFTMSPDGKHFATIGGSAGQTIEIMRLPSIVWQK